MIFSQKALAAAVLSSGSLARGFFAAFSNSVYAIMWSSPFWVSGEGSTKVNLASHRNASSEAGLISFLATVTRSHSVSF